MANRLNQGFRSNKILCLLKVEHESNNVGPDGELLFMITYMLFFLTCIGNYERYVPTCFFKICEPLFVTICWYSIELKFGLS